MKGYCPTCREVRSDNGCDIWGMRWRNSTPICKRCGHYVDVTNGRNSNHNCCVLPEEGLKRSKIKAGQWIRRRKRRSDP